MRKLRQLQKMYPDPLPSFSSYKPNAPNMGSGHENGRTLLKMDDEDKTYCTTDLTVLENNHTLSFFATGCTPQRSSSNDNFHQIRLHKIQVYNLFQPLSFLFDHLKLPRRGGIAVPRRGVFKNTGRKCYFNCKRLLVVTFDKEEYDWPSGYLQTIHT